MPPRENHGKEFSGKGMMFVSHIYRATRQRAAFEVAFHIPPTGAPMRNQHNVRADVMSMMKRTTPMHLSEAISVFQFFLVPLNSWLFAATHQIPHFLNGNISPSFRVFSSRHFFGPMSSRTKHSHEWHESRHAALFFGLPPSRFRQNEKTAVVSHGWDFPRRHLLCRQPSHDIKVEIRQLCFIMPPGVQWHGKATNLPTTFPTAVLLPA